MRSLCRGLIVALLALGTLAVFAVPASAAERAASELVIIRGEDRVSDDLYAVGARVIIEGVVEGDLVAFAAEDVTISGEVTGDVIAVAPMVEVSGLVGGSLRVTGSRLSLSGEVGEDLVGAVWSGELATGSVVGGDVVVWAVEVESRGSIGGDLEGTQRTTRLAGEVSGGVNITVDRLNVVESLRVGDDLEYRSARAAAGLDQVTVGGVVVHQVPLPPNIRVRALGVLVKVLVVIALTATSLLFAWGWPERTDRAGRWARSHTLRAAGYGSLVVLSPVILVLLAVLVAVLAPASAAFPLLVVFAPLVLAASGLVLVLSLGAGVPAVLALGRVMGGRLGLYGAVVAGSAVAGVFWLLPVVGWLVPLLVLPVGLGAWMLGLRPDREEVG